MSIRRFYELDLEEVARCCVRELGRQKVLKFGQVYIAKFVTRDGRPYVVLEEEDVEAQKRGARALTDRLLQSVRSRGDD